MKKVLKISFYTCVPKIAIIWCVVTEMQSETEFFVVLDHFLPFYPPNNLKIKILKKWKKSSGDIIILYMHHIWQTYDVWLLRYGAQQTEFFVILDCFLTFYPPLKTQKIKILKKQKKKPGYIIILHLCTVNDNYMMYGSWDMECGRQNFWSFWTIFLPFYSTNNLKNKKLEKIEKKNPEDIIILHKCTKNHDHKLHCSWDWCTTDLIFHWKSN